MGNEDPRLLNISRSTPAMPSPRPLRTGGGPANYVENGIKAASEPFKGVTTHGRVTPDLFPIAKTGTPTDSIREAAEDFLGSLSPDQRAKTLFPVDTIEWRK